MARRRHKRRTHVGAQNGPSNAASAVSAAIRGPKTMVIRMGAGDVGPSVSQLVKDVRSMMEPGTASNTNLRLALFPRGPTLHFRVEKYSLCKDVRKALRHPKGGGKEYMSPPLLVMNNFASAEEDSASKPSAPKSSAMSGALHDADVSPYVLNLRHYAIVTKPTGLSQGVRRINAAERMLKERASRKGMPNLGKLEDVADYFLDPSAAGGGFTSGSESEMDTDAEVEVTNIQHKKVFSIKQAEVVRGAEGDGQQRGTGVQKRAVKLVELGPRMTLRMTKVEEGVCGGKVMWHEYLNKSEDEIKALETVWETRRREKAERKRIQKENVERKRKAGVSGEVVLDGVEEDALSDDNEDLGSDASEAAGHAKPEE
ncbi:MAG: hypothetical protein Q9182_002204 [Xanthomendoza sp. 2 TL-2023]